MLHGNKPKAPLLILITIYFIFVIIFASVLLMNSEISITDEKDSAGNRAFYIVNNTDAELQDITVRYMIGEETKDLNHFDKMEPKERERIYLDAAGPGNITVIAELPLQKTFKRTFSIERPQLLAFAAHFPESVVHGSKLDFSAEVCNKTGTDQFVTVQEVHQVGFFKEGVFTDDNETIQAGNCSTVHYTLTPLQKGETTIYFNVAGANSTDQYAESLRVE